MPSHLPPFTFKSKTGHYTYRRTVPKAYRHFLGGRWEIKQKLGKDYVKALQLRERINNETERLFQKAAQGAQPTHREAMIARLKKAGINKHDLELLLSGDDVPEDLALGLDALQDSLIDDYKEAERQGKEPPVSFETIKAIGEQRVPQQIYTIASALDLYLDNKREGDETKDRQLENRLENLKGRLVAAIGKHAVTKRPLEQFGRGDARKIRDALLSDGLSPNSVRRMLNPLRAAVNKTIREYDLETRNPLEHLEIKGEGNSNADRHPLTEEDMEALAPVMSRGPDDALGILWTVARDTGARPPGEICRRKVSDVDLGSGSLTIPFGKTKNAVRTVPLSPAALEGLQHLAKGKDPDDYLFPNYATGRGPDSASQALLKRLRTKIGDRKKVVYSLRHRMKDRLRDTDCPADIQEQIMGHDAQSVARNYGRGYALTQMRKYLEKVWDTTPQ